MYSCPSCGGNIKYNIAAQMLKCENCDTTVDPYSMVKEGDAEGSDNMSVTEYKCPQCGGEIIADENEAAAFCTYCGASTILDSKIMNIKRPRYIIPFAVSKDGCASAFKKKIGGALFAPKRIKSVDNINNFRGIYMPYWIYSFRKNGVASTTGTRSYSRGNYDYTDHYNITVPVNYDYAGVCFDCASTFSDNLSQAIAPYDTSKVKAFTPSFLSGFYADASDVDSSVYMKMASDAVADECASRVRANMHVAMSVDTSKLRSSLYGECYRRDLAFFPVWFMSYRADTIDGQDRICYLAVNGQTGKAEGDVPVSIPKYLITSAIVAILLFILFNMGITMRPIVMMLLTAGINAISAITVATQENRIVKWENGEGDLGKGKRKIKRQKAASETILFILTIVNIISAVLVGLAQPVYDIWYYLVVLFGSAISFLQYLRIIGRFNLLTTRPLPQFKRTGGDDSVEFNTTDN